MKISQQFAGSYLKAADLPQPRVFAVQSVVMGKMPEGDEKPVLNFAGSDQALVLNKTNATILAELWGDETTAWHGQLVELYATTTSFGGRMVPCIRVRAAQVQTAARQPAPVPQPSAPQPTVPQPTAAPAQQQLPLQPAPAPDYPLDA
ncbi:MAG: hypothetical protein KDB03_02490 [Planctomycetales bacterium]|nr:hypothetical protein [Planctomycetales bacterium]